MSFDIFCKKRCLKSLSSRKLFFLFLLACCVRLHVVARGSCMSRRLSTEEARWCKIAQEELIHSPTITSRIFISFFGVSPLAACDFYEKYFVHSPFCLPRSLLWTLYFCYNYPKYYQSATPFRRCNVRTYSDTVWGVLMYFASVHNEVSFYFFFFRNSNFY
jgi:hypothetical protein